MISSYFWSLVFAKKHNAFKDKRRLVESESDYRVRPKLVCISKTHDSHNMAQFVDNILCTAVFCCSDVGLINGPRGFPAYFMVWKKKHQNEAASFDLGYVRKKHLVLCGHRLHFTKWCNALTVVRGLARSIEHADTKQYHCYHCSCYATGEPTVTRWACFAVNSHLLLQYSPNAVNQHVVNFTRSSFELALDTFPLSVNPKRCHSFHVWDLINKFAPKIIVNQWKVFCLMVKFKLS